MSKVKFTREGLLKRWENAYFELVEFPDRVMVADFAQLLGYGRQSVYNLIAEERLPPPDGRDARRPGKPAYWEKTTLTKAFKRLREEHSSGVL